MAALIFLPFLALICGAHLARANGVLGSVTNGGIVYGTISGATGVDQYTFTVPSGTAAYFVSIWESGGHSTTSNAEFQVINPSNAATGWYGDYFYNDSLIGSTSGVSGTWKVKVENYESSTTAAAYGLQVAWWPGTIGQMGGQAGGMMRYGETYSGTINIGETDFYSFQGISGQTYTVTYTKTSGGAGFCPYLRIFKPDGTGGGAYSTCTTDSELRSAYTGTNYFYLQNDYVGNGTGSYTVKVSGAGIDIPVQANGDGSTCVTCEAARKARAGGQAPAAQSGPVVSNGAAATPPTP